MYIAITLNVVTNRTAFQISSIAQQTHATKTTTHCIPMRSFHGIINLLLSVPSVPYQARNAAHTAVNNASVFSEQCGLQNVAFRDVCVVMWL